MRFNQIFILLLSVICYSQVSLAQESIENREYYQSPYSVNLPFSIDELIPDLLDGKRGEASFEAKIPQREWYNHIHPWIGPWGPLPHHYREPQIAAGKSDDWKRARVIAAALRYIGYHYRHHYIPDWNPPPGWYTPRPGGTRHDGKGLDCSNFTSFVYNQSLGIGFSSDVQKQAAMESVNIYGRDQIKSVKIIPRQDSFAGWNKVLKPGDLLFIRPRHGDYISHVVIWVGGWGTPEGTSLVLDSHGADVRDSNKQLIPEGIYLRPFRQNSWYATNADHAIRIIGD